jgi:hypothetical protein
MKAGQQDQASNVALFRMRSETAGTSAANMRRDNVIRLLDLSKYEQPRPAPENVHVSMRANIAAMVLLGLLVFIAKEDFGRLEQSNLCWTRSECVN